MDSSTPLPDLSRSEGTTTASLPLPDLSRSEGTTTASLPLPDLSRSEGTTTASLLDDHPPTDLLTGEQVPPTSLLDKFVGQLLDIYSYQFLPLHPNSSLSSSCTSSVAGESLSSSGSLCYPHRTGPRYLHRGRKQEVHSSTSDLPFTDRIISIMAPASRSPGSSGMIEPIKSTVPSIKQNVLCHFSPVNPFDHSSSRQNPSKDNPSKDNPSKDNPISRQDSSKDCRRLSCESHKKCCGSESKNSVDNECAVEESVPSSVKDGGSGTRCGGRSEGKSASSDMKKRSSSCPRGRLFPIPTTLAHVKRTEFNRDRIVSPTTLAHVKRTEFNRDRIVSPGSSTASLASLRTRTPHATPTYVSRPHTVFTANKTPSSSSRVHVSTGDRTPTSASTGQLSSKASTGQLSSKASTGQLGSKASIGQLGSKDTGCKTPVRTTPSLTPKVSTITGKPVPVTEVKASRPVSVTEREMGRRNADVPDGSSRSASRTVALSGKSASLNTDCTVTGAKSASLKGAKSGKQNSQLNIRFNVKVKMNDGANPEITSATSETEGQSSRPHSPSPRPRLSIRGELDEAGEFKVRTTNINVAVRLRPFSRSELSDKTVSRLVHLDRGRNCVMVNDTEFEFNKVLDSFDHFAPIDDQAAVYRAVGKPLLEHALNGYNVCLFAYGQTGSGKTYSITGPEDDVAEFPYRQTGSGKTGSGKTYSITGGPEDEFHSSGDAGIIPRFVHDLFLDVTPGSLITLTYIEIYNDQINNLLSPDWNSCNVSYKVREHPVLGPYIPNLIPIVVDTSEDLLSHISMGNLRRAKAATASNEHSSRSHAIVTISVHQKPEESFCDNYDTDSDSQASEGERIMSRINLVDLAGSERLAAVHSTGDRFKEGTCINKSLLTLGKVISELSAMNEYRGNSKIHVPYRDSTLTFLLKESLGGNSKTCMLATISPSSTQVEETLSTLRYASKASRIVNRVRVNEDPKNRKIRLLEFEILRLKSLLDSNPRSTTPPSTLGASGDDALPYTRVRVESKKDGNNNEWKETSNSKWKKDPCTPSSDSSPAPSSKSTPSSSKSTPPSSKSTPSSSKSTPPSSKSTPSPSKSTPSGPRTATSSFQSSDSPPSTPKKSALKKSTGSGKTSDEKSPISSTVLSTVPSTVSTPKSKSTPLVTKRKGKDQGTLTERLREVDQGTSTDDCLEEIPIVDVGDYESDFIERIEIIFEGKEPAEGAKRGCGSKNPVEGGKGKSDSKNPVEGGKGKSDSKNPAPKGDGVDLSGRKNRSPKSDPKKTEAKVVAEKDSGKSVPKNGTKSEKRDHGSLSEVEVDGSKNDSWNGTPSSEKKGVKEERTPSSEKKGVKEERTPSSEKRGMKEEKTPSSEKKGVKEEKNDSGNGTPSSHKKGMKEENKPSKKETEKKDSWSPESTESKGEKSKKQDKRGTETEPWSVSSPEPKRVESKKQEKEPQRMESKKQEKESKRMESKKQEKDSPSDEKAKSKKSDKKETAQESWSVPSSPVPSSASSPILSPVPSSASSPVLKCESKTGDKKETAQKDSWSPSEEKSKGKKTNETKPAASPRKSKEDKKSESSKKNESNKNSNSVQDESSLLSGLNTGMIQDSTIGIEGESTIDIGIGSTIDIEGGSTDEASRHVNFQDTQEIRYYQPSVTETTAQSSNGYDDTIEMTAQSSTGCDDTIEMTAQSSTGNDERNDGNDDTIETTTSSPETSSTSSKKGKKKGKSTATVLVEELKEKLGERKKKAQKRQEAGQGTGQGTGQEAGQGTWGSDDWDGTSSRTSSRSRTIGQNLKSDQSDDLMKELPRVSNVTEQDEWDDDNQGGQRDRKKDDAHHGNQGDDWDQVDDGGDQGDDDQGDDDDDQGDDDDDQGDDWNNQDNNDDWNDGDEQDDDWNNSVVEVKAEVKVKSDDGEDWD